MYETIYESEGAANCYFYCFWIIFLTKIRKYVDDFLPNCEI
jgi:hypothetical protein